MGPMLLLAAFAALFIFLMGDIAQDVVPKPAPEPAPAPEPGPTACGDVVADNHDPASAAPPGDNRACVYSCAGLRRHFGLSASVSECYIDAGTGQRWPPGPVERLAPTGASCSSHTCSGYCINDDYCSFGNNTYTVPSWGPVKAVMIQGHALGAAGESRTSLSSRVDAVGEGSVLVLRHVSMVGLEAVWQPSFNINGNFSGGGAIYVYQGNLTVEFALFRGNEAGVRDSLRLSLFLSLSLSLSFSCRLTIFLGFAGRWRHLGLSECRHDCNQKLCV